jgi:HrpA-like RNA helicase
MYMAVSFNALLGKWLCNRALDKAERRKPRFNRPEVLSDLIPDDIFIHVIINNPFAMRKSKIPSSRIFFYFSMNFNICRLRDRLPVRCLKSIYQLNSRKRSGKKANGQNTDAYAKKEYREMTPHELPVYRHKDMILNALQEHQAIVVESPTGSGKTTQLPIILHEAGYSARGMIGVTQPRRIAALSVGEYIAKQLKVKIGGLVGYKMRFEDKTSSDTKIKLVTDGMLLQEMKLDPMLSKYSVIMVDEAHERSLNIDFILGLLKRVLEARPEFKVIVSSATINAEVFSEYFGECPVVKIDAIAYPVSVIYDPPAADGLEDALQVKIEQIVNRIVHDGRNGDILIFLPGEKAIKDCMSRLSLSDVRRSLHIVPLYSRLAREEQDKVFDRAPFGRTKVVIATNIAETSVTIDGITSVIDSGLSKLNYYNPRSFTSSLVETPISKASANQRKGRAGRTQEGSCYRLYSRKDFENRPLFTTEEIYRTDLSEVVLRMAELGISNFEDFDFISQPGKEPIRSAIETLSLLDALNPDRSLSKIGEMMCAFPLLPRHSRMIVEAILAYPNVVEEVITAASFLTTQSPYLLPAGEETEARQAHHAFRDPRGDFVSYLRIFKAFKDSPNRTRFCERSYLEERAMAEIFRVKEQLELIVSDLGMPILSGGPTADYLCAVSRGLIQFVAVASGREEYRTLTVDRVVIHPGSVMYKERAQYIVAGEIVRTTRTYAMSVSPLDRAWLQRISPILAERLGGGKGQPTKVEAKKLLDRDFTKQIKLYDTVFPIDFTKGKKKLVIFDWQKLFDLKERIAQEPPESYADLRGEARYQRWVFLAGEKIDLILKVAPFVDVRASIALGRPSTKNYNSTEDRTELLDALSRVLTLVPAKGKTSELGFVALFSDGQGNYWFKNSRGFHTALNESLASMESLIDEVGETLAPTEKDKLNLLYRRLSSFLE